MIPRNKMLVYWFRLAVKFGNEVRIASDLLPMFYHLEQYLYHGNTIFQLPVWLWTQSELSLHHLMSTKKLNWILKEKADILSVFFFFGLDFPRNNSVCALQVRLMLLKVLGFDFDSGCKCINSTNWGMHAIINCIGVCT